ncbi:MAG TPA: tetratricopeptide repeat protein [Candidatus Wallbacteria bacterium]|nr:tetratricopeptide repeat protein [Candidatus Wallbacteria bacterium]
MHNQLKLKFIVLFITLVGLSQISGCGCSKKNGDYIDPGAGTVNYEKFSRDNFVNSFQAYLREIDNIKIIKKVKKNVEATLYNVITETAVLSPYELAYEEGMNYYKLKRFDDSARCFKRALSYPSVPPNKVLEIKFLLMDSFREQGKDSEYSSQLNEYKQKYVEIKQSCETEFASKQQQEAIIFTFLKKYGAPINESPK